MPSLHCGHEPAFSVVAVIAMKDAAETIGRAVSSALAQPEVAEVLVVDDGSRDGGAAVVSRLAAADPRVRLIRRGQSEGPASARNLAIAESRAPFLAVLDADDYWTPGRLAKLAPLTEGHDFVADDLLVIGERQALVQATPLIGLEAPIELGLQAFLLGNVSRKDRFRREWGFLKPVMRRAFLAANGLAYDPRLRLGEDFILYSEALVRGARFRLVGPCGYVAVQRSDSLSVAHHADDLARLLEAARRLRRRRLSPGEARALRRYLKDLTIKTRYRQVLDARAARGLAGAVQVLLSHADALPAAVTGFLSDRRSRTPATATWQRLGRLEPSGKR